MADLSLETECVAIDKGGEFTGGCQCSDQLPRYGRGWQEYKKSAKVSVD